VGSHDGEDDWRYQKHGVVRRCAGGVRYGWQTVGVFSRLAAALSIHIETPRRQTRTRRDESETGAKTWGYTAKSFCLSLGGGGAPYVGYMRVGQMSRI
jgi:hypothetical protein